MRRFKTLEQERAKLCLICVKRIKLLKEGEWMELEDEQKKDFLPFNVDEFENFKYYEGAKREAFNKFQDELKKKENEKRKKEEVYENFKANFKLDYCQDYHSHARRLPQLIISNGVIPTLAFYKSKGKDRGQIYQDISEMLEVLEFSPYTEWKNKNQNKDLLEFLLYMNSQILRLTTTEILSLAIWLQRMVEVELKDVRGEEE